MLQMHCFTLSGNSICIGANEVSHKKRCREDVPEETALNGSYNCISQNQCKRPRSKMSEITLINGNSLNWQYLKKMVMKNAMIHA